MLLRRLQLIISSLMSVLPKADMLVENRIRLGSIISTEKTIVEMNSSTVNIEKLKLFKPLKRWVMPGIKPMMPEIKSRLPISKFSFFFFLKKLNTSFIPNVKIHYLLTPSFVELFVLARDNSYGNIY